MSDPVHISKPFSNYSVRPLYDLSRTVLLKENRASYAHPGRTGDTVLTRHLARFGGYFAGLGFRGLGLRVLI